jgi:hypothetical protein
VAVLGLVLAACGGQPSARLPARATPVSAPSPSSSPSPAQSPSRPPNRRAAIAAYLAIWPAHQRAERSRNAAKARAILAPYATNGYARSLVGQMRGAWGHHEVAAGRVTDHILHAGLGTSRSGQVFAIIADCQDASRYGLAHPGRSRRIIPGTAGPRHAYLSASLTFSGGHWRVRSIQYLPHAKC